MKVYTVQPGSSDIKVSDGRVIHGEKIAWGEDTPAAITLSRLILQDVDAALAHKYVQLFKRRVIIATWRKGQPCGITEQEVRDVIAEIDKIASDPTVQKMRNRVALETPPIQDDRANKALRQEWTSEPELRVNLPKREDGDDATTAKDGGTETK